MVKIRLMRMGKRKQPSYRVVVADARSPRDGRFIENIGKYNPRVHPSTIDIDQERALHWLQRGAQPSDPVRVLLQKTGIWSRFTGQAPPEPVPAEPSAAESEADAAAATNEPESSPEGTPLVTVGDGEGSQGEGAAEDSPPERDDGT
jgi:small subunit ribosomal protein S16